MLAVLVRTGEVLGVAVVAALAAGIAGWWWLRRMARLVRARAPGQVLPALRGHGPGTGVRAGR